MSGVRDTASEKGHCEKHDVWDSSCRECFAIDPASRKRPTAVMFAHAENLASERNWKDVAS